MNAARRTWLAALSASAASFALPARAQMSGAKPLTIVIPFAPGGASDAVVRTLSDALAHGLLRPVVAENKGGAAGLIAAATVGRAAPDGSTLLYGNQGTIVVARHLFLGSGPDPRSALVPVVQTARTHFLLVVALESPLTDAAALARAGRIERLR